MVWDGKRVAGNIVDSKQHCCLVLETLLNMAPKKDKQKQLLVQKGLAPFNVYTVTCVTGRYGKLAGSRSKVAEILLPDSSTYLFPVDRVIRKSLAIPGFGSYSSICPLLARPHRC